MDSPKSSIEVIIVFSPELRKDEETLGRSEIAVVLIMTSRSEN